MDWPLVLAFVPVFYAGYWIGYRRGGYDAARKATIERLQRRLTEWAG